MRRSFKFAVMTLVSLGIIGSACAFAACGDKDDTTQNPSEHVHTFATEWSHDETYHWHAATCGHSEVSDKAVHTWDNGNKGTDKITYTCTVCGATKEEAVQPEVGDGETMYTFEAEYAPFDSKADCGTDSYPGYSNSAVGAQVISPDVADLLTGSKLGAVADDYQREHNQELGFDADTGWFVSYMYIEGATIRFFITAEEDTTATLYLRYAGQVEYTLTYDKYQVLVNGTMLEYDDFDITGSYQQISAFQTRELGEIELKKGENVIELVTANNDKPSEAAGRYEGLAPVVDSISLACETELTYTEGKMLTQNLEDSQSV